MREQLNVTLFTDYTQTNNQAAAKGAISSRSKKASNFCEGSSTAVQ